MLRINISQVLSKNHKKQQSQKKQALMGACFFETLRCMEVDYYLKALGRYFLSISDSSDFTASNFNIESSVTFRIIFLPLSLSDTPVALNVYLIPHFKLPAVTLSPCKISALPYFPVSISPSSAEAVVPLAKHFPFWRLVLMLVFSPSAKVKASDTCARAI